MAKNWRPTSYNAESVLSEEYFKVPSAARVWDYWLGGKNHYEVDRIAGEEAARKYPEIVDVAKAVRQMLVRVVGFLAGSAGVDQFLDIGTGLPTMENTHEVAQRFRPEARVVYVDNDPVVLAHARALLCNTTSVGATHYIHADVRAPEGIVSEARGTLDFTRPIVVMLVGILGHAAETSEQARLIIAELMSSVPSGSYLVFSDGAEVGDEGFRQIGDVRGYRLTTPDEFLATVAGLELVEPGLVPTNQWRPTSFQDGPTKPLANYVVVARKP